MFMRIGFALVGLVGKQVSDKTARVLGIVAAVALLGAILAIGYCAIRGDAVADYKAERQGEIDRGVLKADRAADNEQGKRDQEFANSQANVQGSVTNAIASDPNHGATPVGPVQQSYFDELRRQQRDRAAGPEPTRQVRR